MGNFLLALTFVLFRLLVTFHGPDMVGQQFHPLVQEHIKRIEGPPISGYNTTRDPFVQMEREQQAKEQVSFLLMAAIPVSIIIAAVIIAGIIIAFRKRPSPGVVQASVSAAGNPAVLFAHRGVMAGPQFSSSPVTPFQTGPGRPPARPPMIYCPKCGAPHANDGICLFCEKCGSRM